MEYFKIAYALAIIVGVISLILNRKWNNHIIKFQKDVFNIKVNKFTVIYTRVLTIIVSLVFIAIGYYDLFIR